MRVKVELTSMIFNDANRRQTESAFVKGQAEDFKNLTMRRMIESQPAGRFYPRGTKSDVASRRLGHRASASGQRPAIDTGNLVTAISDERVSETSSRVFVAPLTNPLNPVPADFYAEILQNKRNRPIMSDADAEEAQRKIVREGEELAARFTNDAA